MGHGVSRWELEVTPSLPVWRLLALRGPPGPALVPAVGAEVQVSPSTTVPPTAVKTKQLEYFGSA